jgi:catechol 2,3-dioxygenase-like lactoylglutathione lyase family enzyme
MILAPLGQSDFMKKPTRRRISAKKAPRPSSLRRAGVKHRKPQSSKASVRHETEGKLAFNQAMIYVKDVERGLVFYRDLLGFKLIEDFRYENKPVYARLRAPGGDGTIALHQAGPGESISSDGVRLYFEVRELDEFCRRLQQRNFYITKLPSMMPWGWRHAYLNDPDGHEISLYWAGENRMKKTMIKTAQKAARQ